MQQFFLKSHRHALVNLLSVGHVQQRPQFCLHKVLLYDTTCIGDRSSYGSYDMYDRSCTSFMTSSVFKIQHLNISNLELLKISRQSLSLAQLSRKAVAYAQRTTRAVIFMDRESKTGQKDHFLSKGNHQKEKRKGETATSNKGQAAKRQTIQKKSNAFLTLLGLRKSLGAATI
jgi:hypothetical protein